MPQSIGTKQFVSLLIAALAFVLLVGASVPGVGMPLFAAVLVGLLFWNARRLEKAVHFWAWLFAVPILALASTYMLYDVGFLRFLNLPVMFVLMLLLTLALNGDWGARSGLVETVEALFVRAVKPFAYFGKPFRWIGEKLNVKKHRGAAGVLIGVAVAIPIFLILLSALSASDEVFGRSMQAAMDFIERYLTADLFSVLQGLFIGFYGVGVVCAMASSDGTRYVKPSEWGKRPAFDPLAVLVVQAVVAALYAVFTFIQFKYLFGASPLPFGLNHAEYARQGFFSLIGVSLFNFTLLLAVSFFTRNSARLPAIKTLSLLICAATMVMLASSFYRMNLYEQAYGFTVLRLLVYAFLLFEAVCLLFTAAYVLTEKVPMVFAFGLTGLLVWTALNFADIDAMIARRNVDNYLSGKVSTIDVEYLMRLSPDAIPELIRLDRSSRYQTEMAGETFIESYGMLDDWGGSETLTEHLSNERVELGSRMSDWRWSEYDLSVVNAVKALKEAGYSSID
jgi:hypothetical protein